MNPPTSIPSGVLALVGDVVVRQREAERRCLERLARSGFKEVVLPVLEYAVRGEGEGYRFVDRAGRVVALRTDFTPLAARVMGRSLRSRPLPTRICYAGEVVRPKPARLRELPELYQLGFESYGAATGGEEACLLTLDLLEEIGVGPAACHITVSLADLSDRILEQLAGDRRDSSLDELMRVRDVSGLVQALALNGTQRRALEAAMLGEPAPLWAGCFGVADAVSRLLDVCAAVEARGGSASVDAAPTLQGSYYRGMVFTLWGRTTRAVLASGGEYEIDIEGQAAPAAGACILVGVALEESC